MTTVTVAIYYYYLARQLVLILPFRGRQKAESTRWFVMYHDGSLKPELFDIAYCNVNTQPSLCHYAVPLIRFRGDPDPAGSNISGSGSDPAGSEVGSGKYWPDPQMYIVHNYDIKHHSIFHSRN